LLIIKAENFFDLLNEGLIQREIYVTRELAK